MDNIVIDRDAIEQLARDPQVAQQLRPVAEKILGRARRKAPSWLDADWSVKAGVGPRGAFAQAIARGSGVLFAEYGGSRSPAHAFMRGSAR